jgi:hypothetical protein
MQTKSIGGSFYFLTFIDDFSRKIWIYFLRHNSDTFAKFKEFKAEAEKQNGKYIKALRSDGGGEYNSSEFTIFCKSQGIILNSISALLFLCILFFSLYQMQFMLHHIVTFSCFWMETSAVSVNAVCASS